MIIITGGAGFIGSALVWQLNQIGEQDIVVVDSLSNDDKWKNLVGCRFQEYLDRSEFMELLLKGAFGNSIKALIHFGAISSTTETDADLLIQNNYRYTQKLAQWWESHPQCRFLYASSAATYGDGRRGYSDAHDLLPSLLPLNMYGYSKHLFDLYALRKGWLQRCVGLKFFNVFGPNEYHKQAMRSLIAKAFPDVSEKSTISLFQSHNPHYRDGEQVRDFIYVKDAVAMTLFLLNHPDINGIFNIGTGVAHTWNDVARAMFAALHKQPVIHYIPMPENLKEKYQYFTQADMTKLRTAGCTHQCMTLEHAITEYITAYLSHCLTLSQHG